MNRYQVSWGMVTVWIEKEYVTRYKRSPEHLKSFQNQLLEIDRQLSSHPFEFGEPIDDLAKLELTRCLGFHDDLIVNYGVHPGQRIVIITKLRRRSRNA